MTEPLSNSSISRNEYVAFRLCGHDFCLEIMSIREIRGWAQETVLPHAPSYIRGVTNLRGTVLPIVDLAERLGLGRTEPTARHVIMVTQLKSQLVGLLVEAVSDILTLTEEDIQPTPDVASEVAKKFVQGVVSRDASMIKLLVLDELLPATERAAA